MIARIGHVITVETADEESLSTAVGRIRDGFLLVTSLNSGNTYSANYFAPGFYRPSKTNV
jgi:hypothetical protein